MITDTGAMYRLITFANIDGIRSKKLLILNKTKTEALATVTR